jgi:hypothetical protein
MHKRYWAICMLIIAAFSMSASADTITNYTINFTTANGPAPLSGSFTYNSTIPLFTNFLVTWNGGIYDLTAEANNPTLVNSGFTGASSTPEYGFGIMSRSLTYNGIKSFVWSGFEGQGVDGAGIFDFIAGTPVGNDFISDGGIGIGTPTAVGHYTITGNTVNPVPEPTTLLLLGAGLGGLALAAWRRRK